MTVLRVAVVDDHDLVRAGLTRMLEAALGAQVVFQGAELEPVLDCQPLPDLLLLDLSLGDHDADPALVRRLLDQGVRVLVVSALHTADVVLPMLDVGVAGFVSKRESEAVLLAAARAVLDGGTWTSPEVAALLMQPQVRPHLSAAQERVLVLYASGLTLEAVARHLGISVGTAQTHLKRARAKYAEVGRAMPGRVDVYREARRDGLVE